ncbi:piggyBac transposable element-derived protein 4-like [Heterocephalus glaber]|uniref:PiggyBac transposable element-derived protein 4-like n=1 Tax=Heterocephalus glaber TaxID=10181 RepID=A0AAX6SYR5_HETGA|nr:piggyBac transposable element-derived protein 4-like [Heterocephalus glaber]
MYITVAAPGGVQEAIFVFAHLVVEELQGVCTCAKLSTEVAQFSAMSHKNPLLQLWGEVESESSGDSATDDDLDHVSQRSFDSETEQEMTDREVENEGLDSDEEDKYLTSRNGTKWSHLPEQSDVRTSSENVIRFLPGVKPIGQNANTAIQCWKLFVTDDMLQDIVKYTNNEIQLKRSICNNSNTEKHIYHDTSLSELKAFIGLLYIAGLYNCENLKDLWRNDGCGVKIFRTTMTLQRFSFLRNCLRFDDKKTRQERKNADNLAAIRSFFESFVLNCQAIYTPSEYMTIDEQLASFHGRCSFRQYMPNKPSKYGIKIYALVDAKTFYTMNLEIYPGTQPPGLYSCSNKPYDVVSRLVAPISKSNRNVTFDSWFTSYSLMLHLLKEHQLTSTGIIHKNQAEIPEKMLQIHNREMYSTIFGFQKDITLASYMAKKNKVVLILSTLHHDDKIDSESSTRMKPEIVTFYKKTKCGVNVVDELCSEYDVSRNTKRWPMVVFYLILNMSGINSIIVYKENNKCKISQRDFLRELGLELIKDQLQQWKNIMYQPKDCKRILEQTDEQTGETSQEPPNQTARPARCQVCPTKKDRKTKRTCYHCKRYLCMEHAVRMCEDCLRYHN